MAAERMAVNVVEIDDSPGALQQLLAGLAGAGINVLNLAAFSTGGGKGRAFFSVDKADALEDYASSRDIEPGEYEGFLLSGSDRVGLGADVAKPIADAGVNIVLGTAVVVEGRYHVLIVVEKEDAEKTAGVL